VSDHLISLDEASRRLGVHYMTAYRYVRTGRLPAVKQGAEWRVDPDDLDLVRTSGPGTDAPGRRRLDYPRRLEDRLVRGDEVGAWAVLQGALTSGVDADELYLQVIAPALWSIGEGWASGRVTVAQEHQASAVALRLIGRLGPLFRRPGRTRGTVVVGAPPGDHHSVPSALFSDLLRQRNLAVIDLGGDTPAQSFVDTARSADRLIAVGLCATTPDNDEQIRATIAALHDALGVPVVLGGSAVLGRSGPNGTGADHVTGSAQEGVELFATLADDATKARRRSARRNSS
jgi:MerR family transcriptional regulator, light-induced transcriptional regulator